MSLLVLSLRRVDRYVSFYLCRGSSSRLPVETLRASSLLRAGSQLPSHCRQMSLLYYMRKIPKRFKEFKKLHLNIDESNKYRKRYGPDIAAYLWLLRLKARIHFTNGQWYSPEVKGPTIDRTIRSLFEYQIDAIDAKGTLINYHGMETIITLEKLKFLSFEGCPYIDDSCLSRLVHIQDTLTHLNINGCPEITEHGLVSLHHLRNMERLNMNDLPRVPNAKLVASMLEDIIPHLRISLVTEEVDKVRKQQQHVQDWKEHSRTKS